MRHSNYSTFNKISDRTALRVLKYLVTLKVLLNEEDKKETVYKLQHGGYVAVMAVIWRK
mgnify:CR=1 FL=1